MMTDARSTSHEDRVGVKGTKPAASAPRPALEKAERDAGARRTLFVASAAGLIAIFGVVALSDTPPQTADEARVSLVDEASSARRVVAEVPILSADGQSIETVVRFIAPEPDAAEPDVRTRATS